MELSRTIETETGEMIVKRVSVPLGLEELMEGLAKEVILKKPKDIYIFAAEYFSRLLQLRDSGLYRGNVRSAKLAVKRPFRATVVGQKISPESPDSEKPRARKTPYPRKSEENSNNKLENRRAMIQSHLRKKQELDSEKKQSSAEIDKKPPSRSKLPTRSRSLSKSSSGKSQDKSENDDSEKKESRRSSSEKENILQQKQRKNPKISARSRSSSISSSSSSTRELTEKKRMDSIKEMNGNVCGTEKLNKMNGCPRASSEDVQMINESDRRSLQRSISVTQDKNGHYEVLYRPTPLPMEEGGNKKKMSQEQYDVTQSDTKQPFNDEVRNTEDMNNSGKEPVSQQTPQIEDSAEFSEVAGNIDEEVKSAIAIQSLWRGRKEREKLKEKMAVVIKDNHKKGDRDERNGESAAVAPEEPSNIEESTDTDVSPSVENTTEEVKSAIAIQSLWRGRKERERFRESMDVQFKNKQNKETHNELAPDKNSSAKNMLEDVKSAIVLQSVWRGRQARQALKKDNEKNEADAQMESREENTKNNEITKSEAIEDAKKEEVEGDKGEMDTINHKNVLNENGNGIKQQINEIVKEIGVKNEFKSSSDEFEEAEKLDHNEIEKQNDTTEEEVRDGKEVNVLYNEKGQKENVDGNEIESQNGEGEKNHQSMMTRNGENTEEIMENSMGQHGVEEEDNKKKSSNHTKSQGGGTNGNDGNLAQELIENGAEKTEIENMNDKISKNDEPETEMLDTEYKANLRRSGIKRESIEIENDSELKKDEHKCGGKLSKVEINEEIDVEKSQNDGKGLVENLVQNRTILQENEEENTDRGESGRQHEIEKREVNNDIGDIELHNKEAEENRKMDEILLVRDATEEENIGQHDVIKNNENIHGIELGLDEVDGEKSRRVIDLQTQDDNNLQNNENNEEVREDGSDTEKDESKTMEIKHEMKKHNDPNEETKTDEIELNKNYDNSKQWGNKDSMKQQNETNEEGGKTGEITAKSRNDEKKEDNFGDKNEADAQNNGIDFEENKGSKDGEFQTKNAKQMENGESSNHGIEKKAEEPTIAVRSLSVDEETESQNSKTEAGGTGEKFEIESQNDDNENGVKQRKRITEKTEISMHDKGKVEGGENRENIDMENISKKEMGEIKEKAEIDLGNQTARDVDIEKNEDTTENEKNRNKGEDTENEEKDEKQAKKEEEKSQNRVPAITGKNNIESQLNETSRTDDRSKERNEVEIEEKSHNDENKREKNENEEGGTNEETGEEKDVGRNYHRSDTIVVSSNIAHEGKILEETDVPNKEVMFAASSTDSNFSTGVNSEALIEKDHNTHQNDNSCHEKQADVLQHLNLEMEKDGENNAEKDLEKEKEGEKNYVERLDDVKQTNNIDAQLSHNSRRSDFRQKKSHSQNLPLKEDEQKNNGALKRFQSEDIHSSGIRRKRSVLIDSDIDNSPEDKVQTTTSHLTGDNSSDTMHKTEHLEEENITVNDQNEKNNENKIDFNESKENCSEESITDKDREITAGKAIRLKTIEHLEGSEMKRSNSNNSKEYINQECRDTEVNSETDNIRIDGDIFDSQSYTDSNVAEPTRPNVNEASKSDKRNLEPVKNTTKIINGGQSHEKEEETNGYNNEDLKRINEPNIAQESFITKTKISNLGHPPPSSELKMNEPISSNDQGEEKITESTTEDQDHSGTNGANDEAEATSTDGSDNTNPAEVVEEKLDPEDRISAENNGKNSNEVEQKNSENENEESQNKKSDECEKESAIRIQTIWRGFQARKKLKMLLEQSLEGQDHHSPLIKKLSKDCAKDENENLLGTRNENLLGISKENVDSQNITLSKDLSEERNENTKVNQSSESTEDNAVSKLTKCESFTDEEIESAKKIQSAFRKSRKRAVEFGSNSNPDDSESSLNIENVVETKENNITDEGEPQQKERETSGNIGNAESSAGDNYADEEVQSTKPPTDSKTKSSSPTRENASSPCNANEEEKAMDIEDKNKSELGNPNKYESADTADRTNSSSVSDEEVRAASKIQSTFRKSRRQRSKPRLEDLDLNSESGKEYLKEVLKIQSAWRAYKVRKNIREVEDKISTIENNSGNDVKSSIHLTDQEILKAVTKIQAGLRGYLTRKHFNNIRERNEALDRIKEESYSDYSRMSSTSSASDEQLLEILKQVEGATIPDTVPEISTQFSNEHMEKSTEHDAKQPVVEEEITISHKNLLENQTSSIGQENAGTNDKRAGKQSSPDGFQRKSDEHVKSEVSSVEKLQKNDDIEGGRETDSTQEKLVDPISSESNIQFNSPITLCNNEDAAKELDDTAKSEQKQGDIKQNLSTDPAVPSLSDEKLHDAVSNSSVNDSEESIRKESEESEDNISLPVKGTLKKTKAVDNLVELAKKFEIEDDESEKKETDNSISEDIEEPKIDGEEKLASFEIPDEFETELPGDRRLSIPFDSSRVIEDEPSDRKSNSSRGNSEEKSNDDDAPSSIDAKELISGLTEHETCDPYFEPPRNAETKHSLQNRNSSDYSTETMNETGDEKVSEGETKDNSEEDTNSTLKTNNDETFSSKDTEDETDNKNNSSKGNSREKSDESDAPCSNVTKESIIDLKQPKNCDPLNKTPINIGSKHAPENVISSDESRNETEDKKDSDGESTKDNSGEDSNMTQKSNNAKSNFTEDIDDESTDRKSIGSSGNSAGKTTEDASGSNNNKELMNDLLELDNCDPPVKTTTTAETKISSEKRNVSHDMTKKLNETGDNNISQGEIKDNSKKDQNTTLKIDNEKNKRPTLTDFMRKTLELQENQPLESKTPGNSGTPPEKEKNGQISDEPDTSKPKMPIQSRYEAATKIQSVYRGYTTRKHVEGLKAAREDTKEEKPFADNSKEITQNNDPEAIKTRTTTTDSSVMVPSGEMHYTSGVSTLQGSETHDVGTGTNGNVNMDGSQESVPGAEILTTETHQHAVDVGQAPGDVEAAAQSFCEDAGTQDVLSNKSEVESECEMESTKRNNSTLRNKNMEAEAATKIQAGFRGYKVRKELKMKDTPIEGGVRKTVRRKSSSCLTENQAKKQKENIDLQEKSAVKIQAGIRGFLVRKRGKKPQEF